jgi:hypothetical protein
MTKSIVVVSMALLLVFAAAAQDTPRVETFVGYTYTRANSATNVPAFSMNGGGGQVVYNFNKWIGFVMDMGAVHNGNLGGNPIDTTVSNYLFGPRVSVRYSRLRPYLQILWGGAHLGTSTRIAALTPPSVPSQPIIVGGVPVGPNQPITARINASTTGFAMTVGGGLDLKINKWVSFRPVGLDYYLTRFQNFRSLNDNNQNNLRYTTGFNFTFGAQ